MRRVTASLIALVGILLSGLHEVGASQQAQSKNTIVPGVGVGDYTFDMSKDEVLKRLGKPKAIFFAGETYTLNNLPRRYFLFFGDISFGMDDDAVTGIGVHSPLYKFTNGLGVGDSEQKIKQGFGDDFHLEETEWKDFLIYEDQGLQFEIHKKNRTVMEIAVNQTTGDHGESAEALTPSTLEPFDNVGGKDLRAYDLRNAGAILDTLAFNQQTLWPTPDRLPEGFDPNALLQEGMNPGLGVRALHAEGITGAGVHVGLIDQPLLLDHPEYAGKIVSYHDAGCGPSTSSMHGPGMASQLVGKRCGTAPGAKLHVVAVPSWKADADYYARALDRLVTRNREVREDQKIRVVSVSAQPSGEGSDYANQSLWDRAVQQAQAHGVLVLDCTWHHGFVSLCWLDPQDRESVEACTPGFRNGIVEVDKGHIHVPSAPRTTAEASAERPYGYAYDGGGRRSRRPMSKGGYSDTIPYAAGILALGWQIRPDLTPTQIKEMLLASAYVHKSGARIIHPTAFIELIRKQNDNQEPDRSSKKDVSTLVRQAAAEGRISFKLTTPEEFKEIAGQPTKEWTEADGELILMEYPAIQVKFFGKPESNTPHTMLYVLCEGRGIDIGQNRPIALRNEGDLRKFGSFWGYCAVDLSRLDLSQKRDLLEGMPFDSLTVWPEPGFLPPDFEPSRRLEEGKNPGLGVRSLHQEGINGSGLGIAIIDQPLLRDHIEYANRIRSYHAIEVEGVDVQMHGPPVCSIAVGKTCGVAPQASLHYYAVPPWKWRENRPWAGTVEQIVERNRDLPQSEKVRVISISLGMFSQRDHYDQWQAAVDKAKKKGILVVTCDPDFISFGTLKRIVGTDPDDPNCYGYAHLGGDGSDPVYVPIANRSIASHRGKEVYTFDTHGGASWAVPYLAGLAALAFQVHPGISPDEIVELWQKTATPTQIGPVVNPRGFIEAVKRL